MPIKSRSNKKENAKSKKALEQSNVDDVNQSPAPVIPGLKYLAMLKERNASKKSSEMQVESHESKTSQRRSRLPVKFVPSDDTNINEEDSGSKNEKVKNTPTKKSAIKNVVAIDPMEVVYEEETVIKTRSRRPGKKEDKDEEMDELKDKEQPKPKKARLEMEDNMDVEESVRVKNDRRLKTKIEMKANVCEPKETEVEEVNKKGTRKTKIIDKEMDLVEVMVIATPEIATNETNGGRRTKVGPKETTVVDKLPLLDKTTVAYEPKSVGRRKTKLVTKDNQPSDEKPQEIPESVPMEIEEVLEEKKTAGRRKTKLELKEVHDENQGIAAVEVVDTGEKTKNGGRRKTKVDTKDSHLVFEEDCKKIPGLVMLHNLKVRKSAILLGDGDVESTVLASKIPQPVVPATRNSTVTILGGAKFLKRNKPTVQIPDEKATNKEKNDTKPAINEILVDKVEPLRSAAVVEEKQKSSFLKKVTQPIVEIIPGLASLTDLKRRRSMLHGAIVNPRLKETIRKDTPSKETVTQKDISDIVKDTVTNQKKIIPGLANLSELKRRKSEEVKVAEMPSTAAGSPMITKSPLPALNVRQSSPKALHPFISTVRSSVLYQTPPRIAQRPPAPQSACLTPTSSFLPTPTSILRTPTGSVLPTPTSLLRTPTSILRTPTSILRTPTSCLKSAQSSLPAQARPSVGKRPISCLSDDDESSSVAPMTTTEPRLKMARTEERVFTPSRRQSVTFNNRVEVKEIKGDSFNNESAEESDANDIARMQQQVSDSIEQTKRDLMNKRSLFNGSGGSNPFSMTTSTPTMKHYGTTPVRQNSALSDYLASKKKAEIGSHLGASSVNTSFNFANLPASRNATPSQGQSKSNSAFNHEISDDEMDVDEMDVDEVKQDKSACVIQ